MKKITITEKKLKGLIWKYFIWGKNNEPDDKTNWCIDDEIERLGDKEE